MQGLQQVAIVVGWLVAVGIGVAVLTRGRRAGRGEGGRFWDW